MEVRCDQCQARYRVDDARIGPKGLAMRCGKCGNTFRLARDGTISKPSGAKPAGTPASVEPVAPASTGTPRSMTPLSTKAGPPVPAAERPPEPPPVARPAETPRAAHPAAPQPSVPTPGPLTRRDPATLSAPPRARRPGPLPAPATLTPA